MLLLACAPGPSAPSPSPYPDDFRWGTATAGFQVEMGCPTWGAAACEDPASDWYQWVTDPSIVGDPGLFVSGDPVADGPGMWEAFASDVDAMAADGHNSFRFSIEWSRLFPSSTLDARTVDDVVGRVDVDALARYDEIVDALLAAEIRPLVTVNHYTLPLWVHDGVHCHADPACEADGWVTADRIVPAIAAYAGFLGRHFGDRVDTWATLNEPFATTISGYLTPSPDRSSPPGRTFDTQATVAVMHNQILGHAAMYDALATEDAWDADGDGVSADIGLVLNMVAITPKDSTNEADLAGVDHLDALYHALYLDAVTTGAWDENLDGVPDDTRADLADRLDWIGINYYNQVTVTGLPFPLSSDVPLFDFYPEFSWDPYPEGLAEVIDRAADWNLPIEITENGTPDIEGSAAVDTLDGHILALESALATGAPVRGYHVWSWVDNYEWNHGMDLRFGLYALDPVTKARTARPVAERYRNIVAAGRP